MNKYLILPVLLFAACLHAQTTSRFMVVADQHIHSPVQDFTQTILYEISLAAIAEEADFMFIPGDLIISMPGSPYHLSLMPGLWRKQHLLATLKPGWSPWDVEIVGTTELSHNRDVIVLGTRQWPLKNCLAFRGGDSGKLLLDDLAQADVEALRELGYLSHWEVEK